MEWKYTFDGKTEMPEGIRLNLYPADKNFLGIYTDYTGGHHSAILFSENGEIYENCSIIDHEVFSAAVAGNTFAITAC